MKLHFYHRKKGLIPKLIQYYTGYWNHVSIELDGVVYEALGGRLLGTNGVVMSPNKLSYHSGKNAPNEVVTIKIPMGLRQRIDPEITKTTLKFFLEQRVGRKYDLRGVFGFIFRWVRGKESNYYCSELAIEAIEIWKGKKYNLDYSPTAIYELVT